MGDPELAAVDALRPAQQIRHPLVGNRFQHCRLDHQALGVDQRGQPFLLGDRQPQIDRLRPVMACPDRAPRRSGAGAPDLLGLRWRRVATRSEKRVANYRAMETLAAIVLRL